MVPLFKSFFNLPIYHCNLPSGRLCTLTIVSHYSLYSCQMTLWLKWKLYWDIYLNGQCTGGQSQVHSNLVTIVYRALNVFLWAAPNDISSQWQLMFLDKIYPLESMAVISQRHWLICSYIHIFSGQQYNTGNNTRNYPLLIMFLFNKLYWNLALISPCNWLNR